MKKDMHATGRMPLAGDVWPRRFVFRCVSSPACLWVRAAVPRPRTMLATPGVPGPDSNAEEELRCGGVAVRFHCITLRGSEAACWLCASRYWQTGTHHNVPIVR